MPWVRNLDRARGRVERAVGASGLSAGDPDDFPRLYAVARRAEVLVRQCEQEARVHDLENLLGSALTRSDRFAPVADKANWGAVANYFGVVLSGSVYPIDFPHHFRLAYLPHLRELVVEITLPGVEVIPTVRELRHVFDSDAVSILPRKLTQTEPLYASVVAQVILRTLHELFDADQHGWLDTVTINGMTTQTGNRPPATGRASRRVCLVAVRTSRARFAGLNLMLDDPRANLAKLGSVVLFSSQRQQPIRDLRLLDPADLVEIDVLADVDRRLALEDLTTRQFEHLIYTLLAKMGHHVKHQRSSPDGVVDCLIFDKRPVIGGGIVVHAARHAHSLDRWTVQKLQRAVTDSGASKGILMTSAAIDPRGHAHASGRPLELVDGADLLELIAQHTGIRARLSRQERS